MENGLSGSSANWIWHNCARGVHSSSTLPFLHPPDKNRSVCPVDNGQSEGGLFSRLYPSTCVCVYVGGSKTTIHHNI